MPLSAAARRAIAQAEAEGLVLLRSSNTAGFVGVNIAKPGQPKAKNMMMIVPVWTARILQRLVMQMLRCKPKRPTWSSKPWAQSVVCGEQFYTVHTSSNRYSP